ncbi:MAG: thioredoxin family protein [Candidatus Latescibacteria bacterium]|nr:thioredoxin family protein [Candidatus Latescibacterota bacterium]
MVALSKENKSLTVPLTGLTLIEFWAPWNDLSQAECMLVAELVDYYRGKLEVLRVNIDEDPALTARYAVYTVPTIKLIKDGRVVEEFTGLVNSQKLMEAVGQWIGRLGRESHGQSKSDFVVDWTLCH